jgi:hypothetical protein
MWFRNIFALGVALVVVDNVHVGADVDAWLPPPSIAGDAKASGNLIRNVAPSNIRRALQDKKSKSDKASSDESKKSSNGKKDRTPATSSPAVDENNDSGKGQKSDSSTSTNRDGTKTSKSSSSSDESDDPSTRDTGKGKNSSSNKGADDSGKGQKSSSKGTDDRGKGQKSSSKGNKSKGKGGPKSSGESKGKNKGSKSSTDSADDEAETEAPTPSSDSALGSPVAIAPASPDVPLAEDVTAPTSVDPTVSTTSAAPTSLDPTNSTAQLVAPSPPTTAPTTAPTATPTATPTAAPTMLVASRAAATFGPSVELPQNATWVEVQRIRGAYDALWGYSAAISSDGTIAMSSAIHQNGNAGYAAVYNVTIADSPNLVFEVNGSGTDDRLGRSVSMDGDGSLFAASLDNSITRIFSTDRPSPLQEINGTTGRVALSKDGRTLAIGSTGYLQVYREQNGQYEPIGERLVDDNSTEEYMVSPDLSEDGNTIVFMTISDAPGPSFTVKVFAFDGSQWNSIGDDSLLRSGGFGGVSISGDGMRVAIGDPAAANQFGIISVFQHLGGSVWSLVGNPIVGPEALSSFGDYRTLSLSDDARFIVASANAGGEGELENRGLVQVFQTPESDIGNWTQVGDTILGHEGGKQLGFGVAISNDGKRIALGGPNSNDVSNPKVGDFVIYEVMMKDP